MFGNKHKRLPLPCKTDTLIMRLNKYITDSGYCSRREADRYIAEGRVTVNGIIAELGMDVGSGDLIEVDGERIHGTSSKKPVYIAFNKPIGVTSTTDTTDRTNIVDFIGYKERIFPVGRLDKDSEGLIILTNNGDIVNKILRAGNNNPKEYIVTVDKPMTGEFLSRMGKGVRILGVTTKPCRIVKKNETTFVIYLTQGLNRQIRRMCQALDYKVTSLKRVRVINIALGSLEPGRWRYFTPEEEREMQAILAASSGTEEASNEKKATSGPHTKGSFSDYRRKGRQTGNVRIDRNTDKGIKKSSAGSGEESGKRSSVSASKLNPKKSHPSAGTQRKGGTAKGAAKRTIQSKKR